MYVNLQIFRLSATPVLESKTNKHKKKGLYLHLPNIYYRDGKTLKMSVVKILISINMVNIA